MKKFIFILLSVLFVAYPGFCRDYIIDYLSENYREETEDFKHHLQIYHAIQINSIAGEKILIIKGDNYRYRTWLREYMAKTRKLIIKIPDSDNNNFISSKAYNINVTSIFPIDERKWNEKDTLARLKVIKGKKHILLVDPNTKRKKLVDQVVENIGYPVTFADNFQQALKIFQVQPGNFNMVIANCDVKNFNKFKFVEKLSRISPTIPIIVGGAYNNKKINEKLVKNFANMKNVIVRPVILKDLTRVINNILKKNA